MKTRSVIALVLGAALVAGFSMAVTPEEASSQRRLKAKVFLTQHKIPRKLSERGLINFAKRKRAKVLREITDVPVKERKWKANMVVSFNRPIGDYEFQVLFYDVENGTRDFIGPPLSIMVNKRTEKTFVQKVRLDRPHFKPNRKMEMVVTVKRQEVGKAKFKIVGETVKRSGVVNF